MDLVQVNALGKQKIKRAYLLLRSNVGEAEGGIGKHLQYSSLGDYVRSDASSDSKCRRRHWFGRKTIDLMYDKLFRQGDWRRIGSTCSGPLVFRLWRNDRALTLLSEALLGDLYQQVLSFHVCAS